MLRRKKEVKCKFARNMDELLRTSLLLDFYKELLTEKQREILSLYYEDDLSLAEIAEHTKTSRQAVFDLLKRCNKTLEEYESKLNLIKNHEIREEKKLRLLEKINLLENIDKSKIDELVESIEELV